jgi:hypothetical protein
MVYRNFETCNLQEKHIVWDKKGPGPYYSPYDLVSLEQRKGWQKKGEDSGELHGEL